MSGARAWLPDPDLIAAARRALAAALERLVESGERDERARDDALEAAGRLVALGAPALASEALAARAGFGEAALGALDADEAADELEDAAVALRQAMAATADDGDARAWPDVEAAFARRDRAEYRLLGAALALGRDAERVEAGLAGRLEFETLVRPELWRLCALNAERRAALVPIEPALRTRFWWWHEGADVAPGAVDALPAVAALLAAFPGAREHVEALVRARQAWAPPAPARAAAPPPPGRAAAAGPAGRSPPVAGPAYTLRDWVERRARGADVRGGRAEALPLAAAPSDEFSLADDADYQLSWGPPAELIVDLLADREPASAPSLRLADGSLLRSRAVAGAEERFAFSLPARALDETGAVLILRLARGTLEIALPPPPERAG